MTNLNPYQNIPFAKFRLSSVISLLVLNLIDLPPSSASPPTTAPIQATAVPVGYEVVFACRSESPAVWVKQSPDLANVEFLSHNGFPIDQSVDLERFAFSKVGVDQYVLVVKSVQLSDAGLYKCSNVMTASLTVISTPVCSPTLPSSSLVEKQEVDASCSVAFAGPAPGPRLDWNLGNVTISGPRGIPRQGASSVSANRSFVLTGRDHASSLGCSITHDHWNTSIPFPQCFISPFLNITYKPRLVCPKKAVFHESDLAYVIKCDAFMNPVVHPNDIHWLLGNGNYSHALQNKTKYFTYRLDRVTRGYHIEGILHKSLLSRRTPTRQLTLHVFGPMRRMPTSTAIDLELHHGPTLNCPEQQSLPTQSVVTVTCNLFAYPSIPWENVTWRLGERSYDLSKNRSTGFPNMRAIPGGVALALVADRDIVSLDEEEKKEQEEENLENSDSSGQNTYDDQELDSSNTATTDDQEDIDPHRYYPDTYHVTLQVHLTNGTVEKNITVSASTGEDGHAPSWRPTEDLVTRPEDSLIRGDLDDFFGVVEVAVVTCFFLMLMLITLLVFGLYRRQSGAVASKDARSPCCSWRRVQRCEEDDDDLPSYASRLTFHRDLGIPRSTSSVDYGDSHCESHCDCEDCGGLRYSLSRYGHAGCMAPIAVSNLDDVDVTHRF